MLIKYFLVALALFFTACSIKNYERTSSKIIIIKSPKIKFADLGYIRNSDKALELELFLAGKAIKKIQMNHLICVDEGCMSKSGFNEEYLDSSYPDDLLQNVLLGLEIYDGKNRVKTDDGFEQLIVSKDVDVIYRVSASVIAFKDRKNSIILKIKDIK